MRTLILLAALLAPAIAHADSRKDLDKIDKQYNSCMDSAVANIDMVECSDQSYGKADKLLNKVYRDIVAQYSGEESDPTMKDYNSETLSRLKNAQRAWVTYRDAFCQLRGVDMLGGSGEGLIVAGCLYSETVRQTRELLDQFMPVPE